MVPRVHPELDDASGPDGLAADTQALCDAIREIRSGYFVTLVAKPDFAAGARLLGLLVPLLSGACTDGESPSWRRESKPLAVSGFSGVVLDNDYQDIFVPWSLDVEDSYLVGLAGSARLARPFESLHIELEAQIVRHFHGQTHWELNAPIVTARWTAFPWDRHVDTSAAFGVGLSVTSETPRLEVGNEGESQPLMAYWMFEFAFALPPENWELIARLHHRSTAYGTFGDGGGANALVLGLRRRF